MLEKFEETTPLSLINDAKSSFGTKTRTKRNVLKTRITMNHPPHLFYLTRSTGVWPDAHSYYLPDNPMKVDFEFTSTDANWVGFTIQLIFPGVIEENLNPYNLPDSLEDFVSSVTYISTGVTLPGVNFEHQSRTDFNAYEYEWEFGPPLTANQTYTFSGTVRYNLLTNVE